MCTMVQVWTAEKKIQIFFLHRFLTKTAEKINLNIFSPTFFQKHQKK